MSEDFDGEDDNFFALPHLFELEYTDELREMDALHQNAGCCVSNIETDKQEKKLLNKVAIFVFFAHKKYSRSFIKLRLNHWF